jgi:hypothetical protein
MRNERIEEIMEYCKKRAAEMDAGINLERQTFPVVREWTGGTGESFSYLYFVECDKFVKVGIASDIFKRMSQLQVSSPHPMQLLAAFPSKQAAIIERRIHHMWAKYRGLGEWFKLPDGEIGHILHRASMDNYFNEDSEVHIYLRRSNRIRRRPLTDIGVSGVAGIDFLPVCPVSDRPQ